MAAREMTIAIIDITFRGLLIVLACLLLGYHFPDLRKSIVPQLSVFATDLTENVLVVLRPAQAFVASRLSQRPPVLAEPICIWRACTPSGPLYAKFLHLID
jgi:hypothetical protein